MNDNAPWTQSPPTEDGYYWWRHKVEDKPRPVEYKRSADLCWCICGLYGTAKGMGGWWTPMIVPAPPGKEEQEKPAETPEYIMQILRQRVQLPADNGSMDGALRDLSPEEKFSEIVAWNLGDSGWAADINGWLIGCGLKLKDGQE